MKKTKASDKVVCKTNQLEQRAFEIGFAAGDTFWTRNLLRALVEHVTGERLDLDAMAKEAERLRMEEAKEAGLKEELKKPELPKKNTFISWLFKL